MIPSFAQLFLLSALLALTSPFNNNCVQYEPTNFDNCLTCPSAYYLDSGKCLPCPKTPNNISLCQTIASPAPSTTNTTSSTSPNSVIGAQNQATTTNPQTSTQNSDVNSNTALSQMLLLKNFLPDHCNGFAFTTLGITCTACQQGFLLTPPNTCSPIPTPSTPITPNLFPSFNSLNIQSGSFATTTSPDNPQQITNTQMTTPLPVQPESNKKKQTSQILTNNPQLSVNNQQNPLTASNIYPSAIATQSSQNSSKAEASSTQTASIVQIPSISNPSIAYASSTSQNNSFQSASQNNSSSLIYQAVPAAATTTASPTIPSLVFYQNSNSVSSSSSSSSSSANQITIITPSFQPTSPLPSQPVSIISQPLASALPRDNNCAKINPTFTPLLPLGPTNSRCSYCYQGFFLNQTSQLCQQTNPLCKTIDGQGLCLTCYVGYIITSGLCLIGSPQNTPSVPQPPKAINPPTAPPSPTQDPNCQQYEPVSFRCLTCGKRYYLDPITTRCTPVDSSCQTWNTTTGLCLNCYTGYTINSTNPKTCTALNQTLTTSSTITNTNLLRANCNNIKNNLCTSCIPRFYLLNGMCFPVNDLCKTYNSTFGYCTSCYQGYTLADGNCQESVTPSTNDPYCLTANSEGTCQRCISSYYPDSDGVCQPVSLQCYQYDPSNGNCTACYVYYILQNGQCVYYQNM